MTKPEAQPFSTETFPQIISDHTSVIGLQLESINTNIIKAKYKNGMHIMPFLYNHIKESKYLGSSSWLLGGRSTGAAEFQALCSMDPPQSYEPFLNINKFSGECLPGYLERNGWATFTGHANSPDMYNRVAAYPRLGFRQFWGIHDIFSDDMPSTRMGPTDAAAFEAVVKKINWEEQDSFLHFVGIQSHSPFYPLSAKFEPIDETSYPKGEAATETLTRFAIVASETDESIRDIVSFLQNYTSQSQVEFVFYLYGDHATPIRNDPILDASKLNMPFANLLALDGRVPFLALYIHNGLSEVIPYPLPSKIVSLGDLDVLITESIEAVVKRNLKWKATYETWEQFVNPRRSIYTVQQRRYREMLFEKQMKNIKLIKDADPNLHAELERSEMAFSSCP